MTHHSFTIGKMKSILSLILVHMLAVSGLAMVPEPVSTTPGTGSFTITPASRILYQTRTAPRPIETTLEPLANVLAGEIEILTGIKPTIIEQTGTDTPTAGDISLEFSSLVGSFAATEDLEDQSYDLIVGDQITIRSQYFKGVSYGTVTMLQAITENSGEYSIPAMTIADSPVAAYRTVMIDVARQPSSIGMLKEVVRLARHYKLRYMQLHLTDDQHFTFPFPEVTDNITNNFTYARQDLEDLVAYADARGVTIIPEFDLPGHSARLKASGYLNPSATDADVASPANYGRIQTIIDDMLSVFASTPYFHIGGDESSAGASLIPFLEAMNGHLRGSPMGGKRRMLVWEGFHGSPTTQIPPTGEDRIIVLSWESSYNPPWDLLNAGYEVVNASWKPLYLVGSASTNRYPHISGKLWPQEVLHTWNKDTFMHWQPGRPVFNDAGPNDPNNDDGTWDAGWIGREDQVIGGQMLSWEQNERTIVNDLIPRLPVMADRLWNPQEEDFSAFQNRLDAVSPAVMAIVRPVEILPMGEVPGSPVSRDYRAYTGNTVQVTLRNRTKIPGTIRYETGGFNNYRIAPSFSEVPSVSSSSTLYNGPFPMSGGFGMRARLFRDDNGQPLDGQDYQHFNNWENRVRVTDFDVPRRPLESVPDFASYSPDLIRNQYDQPSLRGPYLLDKTVGQKFEAVLTIPDNGEYFFEMQTRNGRATFYLDVDDNGLWEESDKIISETQPSEVKKNSTLQLAQGTYRFRVDHASGDVAPVLILTINGPGTGGGKDITEYLSLPISSTDPPPAPEPISPETGSLGFPLDGILSWTANGATSTDVYLWRTGDAQPATPTATVFGNSYDPVELEQITEYSWKVVSRNDYGSSESEVWNFLTGIPPQNNVLLLHEEFDGYSPGSIIGQAGLGLGLDGNWSLDTPIGDFTIGAGLSGDNGLVIDAARGDNNLLIDFDVQGWGTGKMWLSFLYRELSYGGHFYVSTGGSFVGGAGHPWTRSFGLHNTTNPGFPYQFGTVYRLVFLYDWDNGNTMLWVDPSETEMPVIDLSSPDFAAAAYMIGEVGPPETQVLRIASYETDATLDDLRIGRDYFSVVGAVVPTLPKIVSFRYIGSNFARLVFTGEPDFTAWSIMGSEDLISFNINETPNTTINEITPGVYSADFDLTNYPSRYFLRVEQ